VTALADKLANAKSISDIQAGASGGRPSKTSVTARS